MPAAPPSGTVFSTSAPSAPPAPPAPAAVSGAVPSTDELRDELLAGAAVAATAAATYAYAAALEEEGQEAMNCVWDAGLLPPGRLPSFLAGLSSDGDSASAAPGSRPATAPGSRSAVCSRRKELALRPQRSWMRLNVDDLDEAGHDDVNRHHGDEDAAHDDERHPFSEHEQALALAALRAAGRYSSDFGVVASVDGSAPIMAELGNPDSPLKAESGYPPYDFSIATLNLLAATVEGKADANTQVVVGYPAIAPTPVGIKAWLDTQYPK
jgi:hypothetical protein